MPEGRILLANDALKCKLGRDQQSLATMRVWDLLPLDDRGAVDALVVAMPRGEQSNCILPLAARDGAVVLVSPRVWHGRWNGAEHLFCVFKDLSAEEEARHQFECLFRSSPSLMALSSLPDRHFVDIHDASLDRLG